MNIVITFIHIPSTLSRCWRRLSDEIPSSKRDYLRGFCAHTSTTILIITNNASEITPHSGGRSGMSGSAGAGGVQVEGSDRAGGKCASHKGQLHEGVNDVDQRYYLSCSTGAPSYRCGHVECRCSRKSCTTGAITSTQG